MSKVTEMKIYLLHWDDENRIEETSFEDFRRRFNDDDINSAVVSVYNSREDAELHARD
jgi:hypothetical protein